MMESDIPTVESELYSEKDYISTSKPTFNEKNVVSKFTFTLPPPSPKFDSDGDLIVERKPNKDNSINCIEIEHSSRTILDLVGLQIWRGALLLADWLIYNGHLLPKDKKILELGSGVGLTSIVAAKYAPVICTDVDKGGILDLIRCNVTRNKHMSKHPVTTIGLDFTLPFSDEIKSLLPDVSTILAADVIYDDDITEAFVNTIYKLLEKPPARTMFIALEKRYVFVIDDLMTNAPCYDHFLKCLEKLRALKGVDFQEQLIDFPQYFDYDRVKQLVLWKITSSFN